jgi:hypothetical protein
LLDADTATVPAVVVVPAEAAEENA